MEKPKGTIDMGQPVKLGQFILALLGMLITVSGMIYAKGSEDATTLKRIEFLEKQFAEYKEESKKQEERTTQQIQNVANDVKNLNEKANQILVIVQNKQDRK